MTATLECADATPSSAGLASEKEEALATGGTQSTATASPIEATSELDTAGEHALQSSWTLWWDQKRRNTQVTTAERRKSGARGSSPAPGEGADKVNEAQTERITVPGAPSVLTETSTAKQVPANVTPPQTTMLDAERFAASLIKIGSFSTVEGFYRLFRHLRLPSACPVDYNLSLFRSGYRPMWEDFPKGGMWIIRTRRGQLVAENNASQTSLRKLSASGDARNTNASGNNVYLADALWETLVLACIGEIFAMPEVAGCVVSVRNKEIVFSVWNIDNDNPTVRFKVGQKLRDICALPPNFLMRYKDFEQALKDCSSYRNAQRFIFATPADEPLKRRKPVFFTKTYFC